MTKAEQEQVNEYNWSQVPTYEGGRRSKRLATTEGGAKHEPPEEDVNMYDCFMTAKRTKRWSQNQVRHQLEAVLSSKR